MEVAIIPAYNPNQKLVELVSELYERKIGCIIVVNDGSEEQTIKIFDLFRDHAIILTHEINQGKGAAIKTALRYIQEKLPDVEGIVILDADGQHRPEDAMSLLVELHHNQNSMVLGVRQLDEKVPLRSLFGNTVTKYVFRLCSGKWISDTQTGLRAFPSNMISDLLYVSGERYEYEMNVLLRCVKNKTPIREVPIATIYHDDKNSCSHFHVIRDSVKIYGNLLAFSGASFLGFLLDYLLFFPLVGLFGFGITAGGALICGNIAARFISAGFNYYLNSTFVFRNSKNKQKSILSYALLACFILVLNSVILFCLNNYLGVEKALAKLITEMLLFLISFTVQKFVIFKNEKYKEGEVL